jgi:hypothetical protein
MKSNQKFTPKYWCVHDKNTDDVFVDTMSKSAVGAMQKFYDNIAGNLFGELTESEMVDLFYEGDNLEVILVELNIVVRN